MSGLVYLAEPIDFTVETDPGRQPSDVVFLSQHLVRLGFSVYRPAKAWAGVDPTSEHGGAVVGINNHALDQSGLLVAYLPSTVRSIGVPMEIERATGRGIPAVVITDIQGSAMISANPLIVRLGMNQANGTMLEWAIGEARTRVRHVPAPSTRRQLPYQVDQMSHPGPTRHYASDAGIDLYTTRSEKVPPGTTAFIPCGVRVQLPPDVFALVTARSSAFEGYGVIVPPGIIDTGYRGELGVPVYRLPGYRAESDYVIPAGSRLAQVVLLPNMTRQFDPIRVDQIEPTDRGENGFGSSGK